jgi:hypothetical protein
VQPSSFLLLSSSFSPSCFLGSSSRSARGRRGTRAGRGKVTVLGKKEKRVAAVRTHRKKEGKSPSTSNQGSQLLRGQEFFFFFKPNFILSQFTHVTSKTNMWVPKWIRLDELYALVVSGH